MLDQQQLGNAFGFEIRAELVPDDARVEDLGLYSDANIKAWHEDAWSFVGVVVTASLDGIDLGSSSLWGLEYGWLPTAGGFVNPITSTYSSDYLRAVIVDATTDAKANLARLSAEYARIELSEV